MARAKWLLVVAGVSAIALLWGTPVSAVVNPNPVPPSPRANTEMTFTSLGPGHGVTGFIADASNPFDPLTGYPPVTPPPGFTSLNESFAGVIVGTPADGTAPLSLYCIDIHTETRPGFGYELGSWSEASVPRVGYVARILNSYYPTVPTLPAIGGNADKAAAVQAAIWYFSDRYVLSTTDPLYSAVAGIAAAVIAAGPLQQPPDPTLTIAPSTLSGPVGTNVGPFVVTSSAATTVAGVGGDMFADAGATVPVSNGQPVASGTSLWLKSNGTAGDAALLLATAQATVPTGNVYLYDGNIGGVSTAQKLILAESATLRTTVSANAVFEPPGSLVVTKTIAGPAAGTQGQVVIVVTCNGTVVPPPFVIPAGAPAGTTSQTYGPLAAGSVCTIIEETDGHTADVTARNSGSGTVVTIPAGGTATADLINTYEVGSLVVNKTITGVAAGQQGTVVISVTCGQTPLADFVIAAGTPAGTTSQTYPGIAAGTVCTATEAASGATATVIVTAEGSPQSATIAPNGSATLNFLNTYDFVPGSLVVNKTIAGPAAGQQTQVGILVACGAPNLFPLLIPAGTPVGSFPRAFTGIPAGSTCTVYEVLDGSTAAVDVTITGNQQQVVITPGGTATVDMVNTIVESLAPVPPTQPPQPPPPATLPRTGSSNSVGNVTPIAAALALTGVLLVLATRRTRRLPQR
jgi:Domain of unknown function (DUF5979)/Thioester domain